MTKKANTKDLLSEMLTSRIKLRAAYAVWPEGKDKEAVKYYIDYGSAIDTATPSTIVAIVSDIMLSSQGDEMYMKGLQALARGPLLK